MSSQDSGLRLEIDGEVKARLESRGIRQEDVEKVVQNAEEKGEKLYKPGENRYLAKMTIEEATFYVEYSDLGEGACKVHTAYSHKSKIEEE